VLKNCIGRPISLCKIDC